MKHATGSLRGRDVNAAPYMSRRRDVVAFSTACLQGFVFEYESALYVHPRRPQYAGEYSNICCVVKSTVRDATRQPIDVGSSPVSTIGKLQVEFGLIRVRLVTLQGRS